MDPPTLQQMGIIPSYAGNTAREDAAPERFEYHPLVCGEHRMLAAVLAVLEGSSPRMRGTLWDGSEFAQTIGIIPAYAGNTFGRYYQPS